MVRDASSNINLQDLHHRCNDATIIIHLVNWWCNSDLSLRESNFYILFVK